MRFERLPVTAHVVKYITYVIFIYVFTKNKLKNIKKIHFLQFSLTRRNMEKLLKPPD